MNETTYYDHANGHRLKPIEERNGKVLLQDIDAPRPTRVLCCKEEIRISPRAMTREEKGKQDYLNRTLRVSGPVLPAPYYPPCIIRCLF